MVWVLLTSWEDRKYKRVEDSGKYMKINYYEQKLEFMEMDFLLCCEGSTGFK